jgi:16S rRNA processing protein RimM
MPSSSGNVRVGRIVGTHGLKGEIKVEVQTDFIERLDVGRRLRLKGDWVTVEHAREHKGKLLLFITGIDHIDKAEALQWEYLESPEAERPELDEDEYVTADLVGLDVFTVSGEGLGPVKDVLLMPAHDVLVVGEILIPAVKHFVKEVDLADKRIVVELIEGMREGSGG